MPQVIFVRVKHDFFFLFLKIPGAILFFFSKISLRQFEFDPLGRIGRARARWLQFLFESDIIGKNRRAQSEVCVKFKGQGRPP